MAWEAGREVLSLSAAAEMPEGGGSCLLDCLTAESGSMEAGRTGSYVRAADGDAEKDRVVDRLLVQQLLDRLAERERMLINMRYFQNMTQSEAADILGISQVQVSRKEKKILQKMRRLASKH